MRSVVEAILYIASSGCQWRMLPGDFPPVSTVRGYFYTWREMGLWKTTESGGISGYDAGKKIKGRKRHIVTDTLGLLIFVVIHAADVQDRDGAPLVLKAIRRRFPWLRHVFADGGYAGNKLKTAMRGHGQWTIEIVKRSDMAKGFVVLPRRWVVERTFAWLGRCRRLAKNWDKSLESANAWTQIASIRMLTRRIARYWIYA
jgi:putative transposase